MNKYYAHTDSVVPEPQQFDFFLEVYLAVEVDELLTKKDARIAELEKTIRAMHAADEAYGCGFYTQDDWCMHYEKLRELVGMPPRYL